MMSWTRLSSAIRSSPSSWENGRTYRRWKASVAPSVHAVRRGPSWSRARQRPDRRNVRTLLRSDGAAVGALPTGIIRTHYPDPAPADWPDVDSGSRRDGYAVGLGRAGHRVPTAEYPSTHRETRAPDRPDHLGVHGVRCTRPRCRRTPVRWPSCSRCPGARVSASSAWARTSCTAARSRTRPTTTPVRTRGRTAPVDLRLTRARRYSPRAGGLVRA